MDNVQTYYPHRSLSCYHDVIYFCSKVKILNVNCARVTAFIFDSRKDVLDKVLINCSYSNDYLHKIIFHIMHQRSVHKLRILIAHMPHNFGQCTSIIMKITKRCYRISFYSVKCCAHWKAGMLHKKLDVFSLTTSYGSVGTYDGACLVRLANWRIQAIELYEWDWDRAAHDLD